MVETGVLGGGRLGEERDLGVEQLGGLLGDVVDTATLASATETGLILAGLAAPFLLRAVDDAVRVPYVNQCLTGQIRMSSDSSGSSPEITSHQACIFGQFTRKWW